MTETVSPLPIPLVAKEPYRILVPCPEPGGEVTPLPAAEVRWGDDAELVLEFYEQLRQVDGLVMVM